jgi:DNA polymerase elongation subunit (family B)
MDLLAEMAKASTRAELAAILPRLLEIVATRVHCLRAGQVPLEELAFTYRLSREPQAYATNTLNAIVARELAARGVPLDAGETIRYVITDYQANVPSDRARATEFLDGGWGYDVARYTEIVLRAAETILTPLGMNGKMLSSWLAKELPAQHVRARLERRNVGEYLGPLFEYALSQTWQSA